jgi:hypothetical protein
MALGDGIRRNILSVSARGGTRQIERQNRSLAAPGRASAYFVKKNIVQKIRTNSKISF